MTEDAHTERAKPDVSPSGLRNTAIAVALITAGGTMLAAFPEPLTQIYLTIRTEDRATRLPSDVGGADLAQPRLDNTNVDTFETQVTETNQQEDTTPPKRLSPEDPIKPQAANAPLATDVSPTVHGSPEDGRRETSFQPDVEILDLKGGEAVPVTPKGVLLSMIGTPYTERSDLVGVEINGRTESLRVGETYPIQGIDDDCEISLLKIEQGVGRAKFRVRCDS